jgi:hypothetical protein
MNSFNWLDYIDFFHKYTSLSKFNCSVGQRSGENEISFRCIRPHSHRIDSYLLKSYLFGSHSFSLFGISSYMTSSFNPGSYIFGSYSFSSYNFASYSETGSFFSIESKPVLTDKISDIPDIIKWDILNIFGYGIDLI